MIIHHTNRLHKRKHGSGANKSKATFFHIFAHGFANCIGFVSVIAANNWFAVSKMPDVEIKTSELVFYV